MQKIKKGDKRIEVSAYDAKCRQFRLGDSICFHCPSGLEVVANIVALVFCGSIEQMVKEYAPEVFGLKKCDDVMKLLTWKLDAQKVSQLGVIGIRYELEGNSHK